MKKSNDILNEELAIEKTNVKYQEDKNFQINKDHNEKVEELQEAIKELKIRNKA